LSYAKFLWHQLAFSAGILAFTYMGNISAFLFAIITRYMNGIGEALLLCEVRITLKRN